MQHDVLSLEDCRTMYSDAARACIDGNSDKDYQRMDRMIRGLARLSHWDKRPRSTKVKKPAKMKAKGPDTIMSQRSPIEDHWTDCVYPLPDFATLAGGLDRIHVIRGCRGPKQLSVHAQRPRLMNLKQFGSSIGPYIETPVRDYYLQTSLIRRVFPGIRHGITLLVKCTVAIPPIRPNKMENRPGWRIRVNTGPMHRSKAPLLRKLGISNASDVLAPFSNHAGVRTKETGYAQVRPDGSARPGTRGETNTVWIHYCDGCGQRFSEPDSISGGAAQAKANKFFCANCIAAGKSPVTRPNPLSPGAATASASRGRRAVSAENQGALTARKNQTPLLLASVAGACLVLGLAVWLASSGHGQPAVKPSIADAKTGNESATNRGKGDDTSTAHGTPQTQGAITAAEPPKPPDEPRPSGGLLGSLSKPDDMDIAKWRTDNAAHMLEDIRKFAKENPEDVIALRGKLNQFTVRYGSLPAGKDAAKWALELVPPGNAKWPEGFVWREFWSNIIGDLVGDLTSSPAFSRAPDGRTQQMALFVPHAGDNYGARMRGYIYAPLDGAYTFWISSDNGSELWLSSDESSAHKTKVAACPHDVAQDDWTSIAEQRSAPITLAKGRRYFFEVLHKQGGGNDFVSVGWQLPNGTLERPIQGYRLSPFDENAVAESNPEYAAHVLEDIRKFAKEYPDDAVALHDKLNQLAAQNGAFPAGKEAAKWASELVPPGNGKWPEGFVWREFWLNMNGSLVSEMTANPAFSGAPTGRTQYKALAAADTVGDNFGARIRGFIYAPMDGIYTFWILSDDGSEFWLSRGENPAGKTKIAVCGSSVGIEDWNIHTDQTSAPITLAKGQRYFFEVLHKQGFGLSFVRVGWQMPNRVVERPIPGFRLSPYDDSGH